MERNKRKEKAQLSKLNYLNILKSILCPIIFVSESIIWWIKQIDYVIINSINEISIKMLIFFHLIQSKFYL